MSAVVQLACDLIRRPSVTPADAGCQDLVAARLAAAGFVAEAMPRGDTHNLWLRRGRGRPTFVFAGHTDVVPPGPEATWTSPPFEPVIRDGVLYGRGAADMKGSIAAFAVAATAFVRAHPDHAGSIALLLTSDEEGPATDGTVAVVERLRARGEAIDYALVGEPTSVERVGDTLKNGRRGSLTGELRVRGVQGHVAYPHLARNPVHQLAPALAELVATTWDAGDEHFPPTSLQVAAIQAGTGASNVIPGECRVQFNLRFGPASSAAGLKERIDALVARHGLDAELRWTLGATPFLTPPGTLVEAVGQAVLDCAGHRAALSTTGGTSDGRFLATLCPQVVELGPCNATIHKVDECVRVADLELLSAIYGRVLERLLASPTPSGLPA